MTNMSFIVGQMENNDNDNDNDAGTLEFHPHFYIINGTSIGCYNHAKEDKDKDDKKEQCSPMCTNNGRYCSWGARGITGHQTIAETVRRMCILKHYPKLFWNYIDIFHHKCSHDKHYFDDKDCLHDVYHHSGGIDESEIDDCIKDSGGLENDNINRMLEEELTWSVNTVVETPSLWINFVPYKWMPLTPQWVLESICHGFVYGQTPHICHVCARCGDPALCASRNPMKCEATDGVEPEPVPSHKNSHNKKKKRNKVGRFFLHFFWFSALVGGLVVAVMYYKKNYMEESVANAGGYQNLGMALMSDRT